MTNKLKPLILGTVAAASLLVSGTAMAHDHGDWHRYRHHHYNYYHHQPRVVVYTAPYYSYGYYPYGYYPYYARPYYGYPYYRSGVTLQFGGGWGFHHRHWR